MPGGCSSCARCRSGIAPRSMKRCATTRTTSRSNSSAPFSRTCDGADPARAVHLSIMPRKILVTSALPYANSPLHLGYILEATQTDIWVRFQKMRGNECHYFCADDAHGTPIMIRAQQEGITPEQLIERSAADHRRDLEGFLIDLDRFHSTHSSENQRLTVRLYNAVRD